MDTAALQERLGYTFGEPELLQMALTHPSAHTQNPDNQRLELLGDAVLGMVMAEALYQLLPDAREGELAKARASLICGTYLNVIAAKLDIAGNIIMSTSEEASGGREKPSTLEDTVEALIGGIYLDSNYEKTRAVLLGWYGDLREALASTEGNPNPKAVLNEIAQQIHGGNVISYEITRIEGKPPNEEFHVSLLINGTPTTQGQGTNKKQAEENAAAKAVLLLKKE